MATTPNMGLVLPDVGVTIGPAWASQLNAALESVDAHDHTNGAGRPIPVAGLDIDADLSMAGHGLTDADRLQVVSQAAPLSATTFPVGLYAVGGEAYWNDGAGHQVQLTNNGSVVGATGTITGMLATTSAAYNSGSASFIFSNAGTLAGMEAGSFILRQAANPSGPAITIAAPTSAVTAYTLRVPTTAPATVGRFWFGTTAGSTVTSTWVAPDASTVEVSGTTLRAKVGGILGNQAAYGGSPTGQVALGTITGQANPNNALATVTGNVALGTITGGSSAFFGVYAATGNVALGTITGGSYLAGGVTIARGNIALNTIWGQASPSGLGTVTGNVALGTITGGDNGFGVATGNLAIGTVTGGSILAGGVYLPAGNLALGAVTGGISGASPTGNLAYRTVATENLAELAVTTAKLDSLAVTTAKIGDSQVTTAKIADVNVTPGKLAPYAYYLSISGTTTVTASGYTTLVTRTNATLAGGYFRVHLQPYFTGALSSMVCSGALTQLKLTMSGGTTSHVFEWEVFDGGNTIGAFPWVIHASVSPGTYTFTLQVYRNTTSGSFTLSNYTLLITQGM